MCSLSLFFVLYLPLLLQSTTNIAAVLGAKANWAIRTCYAFLKFLTMLLLFKPTSVLNPLLFSPFSCFSIFFWLPINLKSLFPPFIISSLIICSDFFALHPVFVFVFFQQFGWPPPNTFCRLESSAGQELGASARSWSLELELLVRQLLITEKENVLNISVAEHNPQIQGSVRS